MREGGLTVLTDVEIQAYKAARREGRSPVTALYAARPPVVELDWTWHYQADGVWATFTHEGRDYKATVLDPREIEGSCESCMELVDAWRRRDDGHAWITEDEYEQMDHRALRVTLLDDDGEGTHHDGLLWGTCGFRRTPTETRLDDRYVAETVLDLAHEALDSWAEEEERRNDAALTRHRKRQELIEHVTNQAVALCTGGIDTPEFQGRIDGLLTEYREVI